MAQPQRHAILSEIDESKRRIAEVERSLNDTKAASNEMLVDSRELIDRIERQLRRARRE